MSFRLTGLVAAPYTPFKADGSLNPAVIPNYSEHLLQTGVNGVFICGSTGEGHSLAVEERMFVRYLDLKLKNAGLFGGKRSIRLGQIAEPDQGWRRSVLRDAAPRSAVPQRSEAHG